MPVNVLKTIYMDVLNEENEPVNREVGQVVEYQATTPPGGPWHIRVQFQIPEEWGSYNWNAPLEDYNTSVIDIPSDPSFDSRWVWEGAR